jgi:hypothetical protein
MPRRMGSAIASNHAMPEMVTSLAILCKRCETLCSEGYFDWISTIA